MNSNVLANEGIVIVLLLLCFFLFAWLLITKRQMKQMRQVLKASKDVSYNQQISLTLLDKDLNSLATEVNELLDFEKKLKYETEQKQNQLKQSISDIAHDLRTPITVIKGNLQLLYQSAETIQNERELEQIKICMEKADVLKRMADDFFELALLESENEEVVLERLDLTTFSASFMLDHEDVIRQCHLEPRIEFPEKSLFINGNLEFLQRIYGNLLNNVFKYARETFTLRIVECENEIQVQFINVLTGNQKETRMDVSYLFDRSYRADKARTGHSAGLGLYIVRLLMEKQGGSVSANVEDGCLVVSLHFVTE